MNLHGASMGAHAVHRCNMSRHCPSPPSLQDLVERAGRRHAASIGEEYVEEPLDAKGNLIRPQHQGGWQHITAEEWASYRAALLEWHWMRTS